MIRRFLLVLCLALLPLTEGRAAAAIDGSAQTFATATTLTPTITTTLTNNWIGVFTYTHDVTTTSVTSACCPGGFTLRKSNLGAATEWWGFAPGVLVGVPITVTLSASGDGSAIAVAVHGTFNSALPFFDQNAGVPVTSGPTSGTGCNLLISTTNTDDLLLYACGAKGPLCSIADPAGWTGLQNTGFVNSNLAVSYLIVAAPQTNLAVNPVVADANDAIGIGDGINGSLSASRGAGVVHPSPRTW
jgi:hypothetical protein